MVVKDLLLADNQKEKKKKMLVSDNIGFMIFTEGSLESGHQASGVFDSL